MNSMDMVIYLNEGWQERLLKMRSGNAWKENIKKKVSNSMSCTPEYVRCVNCGSDVPIACIKCRLCGKCVRCTDG